MKTKNNVQKAIFKSMAVVISLVLISFTVNAQDFWKTLLENNSFNEIAMFMVETRNDANANADATANSIDANTFAAYMETETEEALELEDWMTNDNYFVPATILMEEETESPMELESWMTSDSYFGSFSNMFEEETEQPLELESWMTNEKYFSSNTITFENETERPLNLENWMVDDKYWNR
jgi:hypothetical protein